MRRIVVPRLGGPEVLTIAEEPSPVPTASQILVKMRYAVVTYADIYLREGTYRSDAHSDVSKPLSIGGEGAGVVERVGANVKHVKEGDAVIFAASGCYAEYAAVSEECVIKLPAKVALRDAAGALTLATTAHYLSHDTVKLKAGMTCLIHAAAGGVGHLLLQFAKLLGAQVLVTVGSKEKAQFTERLGANRAILYNEEDFLAVAREWGDGEGLDVVYDSVGKATIGRSIQAVRHRGTCVLYGNSSGLVESIAPMDLAARGSIYFTRPRLAHHLRTRAEIETRISDIFRAMLDGKLSFTLARIFSLEEASEAHRLLQSRNTIGKILLSMN